MTGSPYTCASLITPDYVLIFSIRVENEKKHRKIYGKGRSVGPDTARGCGNLQSVIRARLLARVFVSLRNESAMIT